MKYTTGYYDTDPITMRLLTLNALQALDSVSTATITLQLHILEILTLVTVFYILTERFLTLIIVGFLLSTPFWRCGCRGIDSTSTLHCRLFTEPIAGRIRQDRRTWRKPKAYLHHARTMSQFQYRCTPPPHGPSQQLQHRCNAVATRIAKIGGYPDHRRNLRTHIFHPAPDPGCLGPMFTTPLGSAQERVGLQMMDSGSMDNPYWKPSSERSDTECCNHCRPNLTSDFTYKRPPNTSLI